MVKQAMDAWGRVDILVANAGVLRDKSFAKMEIGDFEFVLNVHLMGTVKPVKALWEIMREQNYGRIVVTTSSTGLYGNFGQTNYGAAKLALVGFMNSLKLEGAEEQHPRQRHLAGGRHADDRGHHPRPDRRAAEPRLRDARRRLPLLRRGARPARSSPPAAAPSRSPASTRPRASILGEGQHSVEEVRDNWAKIADPAGQQAYVNGGEQTQKFFRQHEPRRPEAARRRRCGFRQLRA